MARTNYQEWEEEGKLILLQGWARNGLTDEQIANNIGIARSTLWKWRQESEIISNALKSSKEEADLAVENALFKAALEGNTTAQIFWLKNRKANAWRDKVEQEMSHEIKVSLPEGVSEYGD